MITLCCLIYEVDQCGFRTAEILRADFFIDELERVASRVNICSAQGIEMPHIEPAHDPTSESASNYAQSKGIVSISFILFLVSSFFFFFLLSGKMNANFATNRLIVLGIVKS